MKGQGKPNVGAPPPPMNDVEPTPEDPTQAALIQLQGARGVSRVSTQYQTAIAVHRPRDMKAVEQRILYEAAQMGEDFIYSWRVKDKHSKDPDGKSAVEGLSIEGAMILVRNWGNVVVPVDLMDEGPTHFIFKAEFIDLETGFTFPRLYRQRKNAAAIGGMDKDRGEDISFQIGQSKCQRNVVDKAIPSWMKNRAIEAAKSSAAKKFANLEEWVPRVIKYADGLGVTEAQLVARLGKPRDAWTPYDILTFQLIFNAIRDKESSVAEEFPAAEPQEVQGEVVDTTGEEVKEPPPADPPPAQTPTTGDAAAPPPPAPDSKPAAAAPPPPADPPPPKPPAPRPFTPPAPPKGKKERVPGEEG